MDTTGRFAHPHQPASRPPSRMRRWGLRLFAIAALTAAIACTWLLVSEATESSPPPPVPSDLSR